MTDTIRCSKPTISEKTPEPEARKIMFDARPICHRCEQPVEKLEDARAVLFLGRGEWQLCHTKDCVSDAILGSWKGGNPGITTAAYLRRFG